MASIPLRDWRELPRTLAALYDRYGRWLPAALELLLVVLIARLLAELVWALAPAPAAAAWKPAPVTAPERAAAIDLNRILAAQLFGTYQPPANPAAAALETAPETQLNLTLLGIFADAHDVKGSRALIGNGNDEKPYAVGDEVARGVILKAIFADRVVLSRNGRLETLRLDKDRASSAPGSAEVSTAAETPGGEGGESLLAIRNKLLANPQLTANYIRVQPVNNSGVLTGYRVYPGSNRSLFTDSGMHPGDVVTSINGVQLDDPAKSLQLLSDLSQASALSLVVQRGGETQTININLDQ